MPRWRFLEILKYLRFHLKTKRRKNLEDYKFFLAFLLWNPLIENCRKAYNPNVIITIDEQLLHCRERCKFIQYMPNKSVSSAQSFGWPLIYVMSKYLNNEFLFLRKDLTRSADASFPMDVVMKLMSPLFRQDFNVTCDNFFTSFKLLLRLAERQCNLVKTISAN